jgi:hypothetical protein
MAQAGRKTYRSLASIRAASKHEQWGNYGGGKSSDPDDGGGGTEGQRLIVFMVEVAAFRILCDEYPPAGELDLITHGSDALPDNAGGLALRQRAAIALLRSGAERHVPRPELNLFLPLGALAYVNEAHATNGNWAPGDPTTYVSTVCPSQAPA